MIVRSVRRRLGFRGLALILFGIMFVLIGVGVTFNPARVTGLFYTYLPLWTRVGLWAGAGMMAIIGAIRPGLGEKHWPGRTERPPVAEIMGFSALAIAPTERALSFLWGLIDGHASGAWVTGFAVYLLLTSIILLVSRWPEPVHPGDLTAAQPLRAAR